MNKNVEVKPEYVVTLQLKACYEVKRKVRANNEYEAVLEVADYLSADFDLYWSDHDFEVVSVTASKEESE